MLKWADKTRRRLHSYDDIIDVTTSQPITDSNTGNVTSSAVVNSSSATSSDSEDNSHSVEAPRRPRHSSPLQRAVRVDSGRRWVERPVKRRPQSCSSDCTSPDEIVISWDSSNSDLELFHNSHEEYKSSPPLHPPANELMTTSTQSLKSASTCNLESTTNSQRALAQSSYSPTNRSSILPQRSNSPTRNSFASKTKTSFLRHSYNSISKNDESSPATPIRDVTRSSSTPLHNSTRHSSRVSRRQSRPMSVPNNNNILSPTSDGRRKTGDLSELTKISAKPELLQLTTKQSDKNRQSFWKNLIGKKSWPSKDYKSPTVKSRSMVETYRKIEESYYIEPIDTSAPRDAPASDHYRKTSLTELANNSDTTDGDLIVQRSQSCRSSLKSTGDKRDSKKLKPLRSRAESGGRKWKTRCHSPDSGFSDIRLSMNSIDDRTGLGSEWASMAAVPRSPSLSSSSEGGDVFEL